MATTSSSSRFLVSSFRVTIKTPVPLSFGTLRPPVRGLSGATKPSSSSSSSSSSGEPVTHTGQVFDRGDPRRARFVGKQKEVNRNWAVDLVAEEPVRLVDGPVACCDGGGGALGHPRVYLNLQNGEDRTCGYCGLRYRQGSRGELEQGRGGGDPAALEVLRTGGRSRQLLDRVLRSLVTYVRDRVSLMFLKLALRVVRKMIRHRNKEEQSK